MRMNRDVTKLIACRNSANGPKNSSAVRPNAAVPPYPFHLRTGEDQVPEIVHFVQYHTRGEVR